MFTLLLLLNFLLNANSLNFFQNSTGLFQDGVLLTKDPLNLNFFLTKYNVNGTKISIDEDNILINDALHVTNDISINCLNKLEKCSLILQNMGTIIITNGSIFSLDNFYIELKNSSNQGIFVEFSSSLYIKESNLIAIPENMTNFCFGEENSSIVLETFSILNFNRNFESLIMFFLIKNSSFKLINSDFQYNNFSNFIFIKSFASNVQINNLTFSNNVIKNSKEENIIDVMNYMEINSSYFYNNSINSILIVCSADSNKENYLKISSTKFIENKGLYSSGILLLKNNLNFHAITLESLLFSKHISESPIIEFNHISILRFISIDFIENISRNLIYLSNINDFLLEKTAFRNNNNLTSNNTIVLFALGSCLKIEEFLSIMIKDCLLMNSFGNVNLPGFYISNEILQQQKIQIIGSVFINNRFSSENFVGSLGCVFYFISVSSIFINQAHFQSNIVNLTAEAAGGSCIYFFHLRTNIEVNLAYFEKNYALKGSLIFEGRGDNISLTNAFFFDNSQLTEDLEMLTFFIIRGEIDYLFMKNCLLINNLASYGLFYFTEINNFVKIELDAVSMFYNFGKISAGVYGGQETYNRTILWKNSEFKCNIANGQAATFCFIYIVKKIVALNFTVENFNLTDNSNPYLNALYISWCLTEVPIFKFLNCLIANNSFHLNFEKNDIVAIINLCGFLKGYQMIIENTVFDDNYCFNTWYIVFYVQTILKNVIFRNNSCNLTGLFYFDGSILDAVNTTIRDNRIDNVYFIVFTQLSQGNITNMTFINNSMKEIFFASLKFNSFTLKDIKIMDISVSSNGAMFFFKKTTVDLIENLNLVNVNCSKMFSGENSTITLVNLNYSLCKFGYIFDFWKKSSIFLKNSIFYFHNIEENEIILNTFLMKDSIISLEFIEIYGFSVNYYNKFSLINSELIIIDNCKIKDVHFAKNKFLFYLINSNATINSSFFVNTNNILSGFRSKILISYSSFTDFNGKNISTNDYFIACFESISFIFESNLFSNITLFSSIVFLSKSFTNNSFYITNCSFISNLCFECSGSSLYVSDLKINIEKNLFYLNTAKNGGSLFMQCAKKSLANCKFNLTNNSFMLNSAILGGGAYKWEFLKPISKNNSFVNNQAKYGNNFASFFCRLGLRLNDAHNSSLIFDSVASNYTDFFVLSDIASTQTLPVSLRLYPLDSYGQIILETIKTIIQISLFQNENYFMDDINFKTSITNLTINDEFYLNFTNKSRIYGELNLAQTNEFDFVCNFLSIISSPTSLIYLKFSADGLIKYQAEIYSEKTSPNEITNSFDYFLVLPISLKPCKMGEIYDFINQKCVFCPANYFSSDPKSPFCAICPKYAICDGMNTMSLEKNYWRSNGNSLEFEVCNPYIENCIGGVNASCADEYKGILCVDCANDRFFKNFLGKCQECNDKTSQILKNIFLYLILLIVLFMFCYFFIVKRVKESHKLLLKIFIIYFHYLIANFSFKADIHYPPLKDYFIVLHNMSKLNFWISIFCFDFPSNKLYESFFLIILLYSIFCFIYISTRCKYGASLAQKAVFVLFYIISPMFFNFLISNFICVQIDGQFYLYEDTTILCSDPQYYLWNLLFFIPNMIIYCIVLPFIIFRKLKKNDKTQDKIENLSIYTIGYKKKYCYFDVLLYFRNILMIFFNVYQISVNVKVSILLVILTYSLMMEFYLKVYEDKIFFKLATLIQMIFMVNNYLLIYSTNTINSENLNFSLIIFPILLLIHTYFLISCSVLLLQGQLKNKILKKMDKVIKKKLCSSPTFQPMKPAQKIKIFDGSPHKS